MASPSATRTVLDDQSVPLVKRSATTVLLQLRSYVLRPPNERSESHDEFYILWMDLDRRGFPVPAVLRGALAPATAHAITARVIGDGADPVSQRIGWWQAAETIGTADAFRGRATRYLADLVDNDMGAFLSWTAPDPQSFVDLEPAEAVTDATGQWLWERFTMPPAEWSETTRALEADPPEGISERLLAQSGPGEPDDSTIAESRARVRELMAAGEYDAAMSEMSGLVIVRPFDARLLDDLASATDAHDVVLADKLRRRAASYTRLL